jgi:hypothetical protein
MAFFGDLGKALGLGSTQDVVKFAANAGASYATGGAVPIVSSPFEQEEPQMADLSYGSTGFNRGMTTQPMAIQPTQPSFLGGLGNTIGNFGRDVGGFFQDIAPFTNLFTGGAGMAQMRPQAAQTVIRQAPDESSTSGEITGANLGFAAPFLAAGRGLIKSPVGQGLLGGGALGAAAMFGGNGNGAPRITRRMKSDVRKIYMMAGMDPNATAAILNNLGTYPKFNFDASLVFFILTKRFRNDGPVVTKAAVRKTKTTLRRMKGVVDMYNSVCKPTTRRAPARRAAPKAVQLIKN